MTQRELPSGGNSAENGAPMLPVLSAVPYGLQKYMGRWTGEQLTKAEGRFQAMPLEREGAVDFLRRQGVVPDETFPDDVTQWPSLAARVQVDASARGRLPGLITHAGFAALGVTAVETVYEENARAVYAQTDRFGAWNDLVNANGTLESLFGNHAADMGNQIAVFSGRSNMDDAAKLASVRRWYIDRLFDDQMRMEGERYLTDYIFDPTETNDYGLPKHPPVNEVKKTIRIGRILKRVEENIYSADAYWQQNLQKQVDAYHTFGGRPGRMLYETPQTREISSALKEAGFSGAEIPWLVAERPIQIEAETVRELELYGLAGAYAMEMAYALLRGDEQSLGKITGNVSTDFQELKEMLQTLSLWKIPDMYPRLPLMTNTPLNILRPDLAFTDKDGQLQWVATEHENCPGGLGMLQVAAAGYDTGNGTELLDIWKQMFEEMTLPNETIDRNTLTIVMSRDWEEYATEMRLFLNAFSQNHNINTHLMMIEDLASGGDVPPGFVLHFAYPWNMVKEAETLETIALAKSEKIIFSEAVRAAEDRLNATERLYNRHGEDVYVFNDPSYGLLMFSKVGMAMYHLPGFRESLREYMLSDGVSEEGTEQALETFYNMAIRTTPVISDDGALGNSVDELLLEAREHPEQVILKVGVDRVHGRTDWGGHGTHRMSDVPDLEGFLQDVNDGENPYVAQQFITHARWEKERTGEGLIKPRDRQQVLIFNNNPNHAFLKPGEGVPQTVATRWNPYIHAYRVDGRMKVAVALGSMTLTPIEGDQYKVHGTSVSAEVPVILKEEEYARAA